MNTIFPLIENKIPSLIKTLYPNAKNLILDFFKFLEQDHNTIRELLNFQENNEISNQVEPYIDYVLEELGWKYQYPLTVDKKTLILVLRDLYLSKGSKKSFNALFRILFGIDCEISYPRDNLFTLSNATFANDTYILTTANNINSLIFKSILESSTFSISLKSDKSKIITIINDIQILLKNNVYYLVINIDNPVNDFIQNETITIFNDLLEIKESIFNTVKIDIINKGNYYQKNDVINITGFEFNGLVKVKTISKGYIESIQIINPGVHYVVGDVIKTNIDSGGKGFYATVSSVNVNGGITGIKVYTPGYDFTKKPILTVKSEYGNSVVLDITGKNIGGIESIKISNFYWKKTGTLSYSITSELGNSSILQLTSNKCKNDSLYTFKDEKGFLGTYNSIVHDSNFFQHYSYALSSTKPENAYKEIVDDLLHPVGFIRYNKFNIIDDINVNNLTSTFNLTSIKLLDFTEMFIPTMSSYFELTKEYNYNGVYKIPNRTIINTYKFSSNFGYTIGDLADYTIDTLNINTLELKALSAEITQGPI